MTKYIVLEKFNDGTQEIKGIYSNREQAEKELNLYKEIIAIPKNHKSTFVIMTTKEFKKTIDK